MVSCSFQFDLPKEVVVVADREDNIQSLEMDNEADQALCACLPFRRRLCEQKEGCDEPVEKVLHSFVCTTVLPHIFSSSLLVGLSVGSCACVSFRHH